MPRGLAVLLGAALCAAISCDDSSPVPARPDAALEHDAGAPPDPCGIDLQVWALEDAPLTVPLRCESGGELPRDTLRAKQLPAGAELDLEAGELRWTPGLDQAGNHTIELRLSEFERGRVRIGVADRFEHPDNQAIGDPENYTHEFGVPVFHLGVGPRLNGNAHTPAKLVYAGKRYEGASAKYRGATSSAYPKRSFTLRFDEDAPFVDAARGFPGARRVVLTTNFDDNSSLRQRLSFAVWNHLHPEHIAVQSFNAVVYLDGKYLGLYQATDHVDDDFLRAAGVARGVNMYKGRTHAANFWLVDEHGNPKQTLHAGYSKEEGLPEDGAEGAYADLDALVDWLANASDDDFAATWEKRLARSDFEDWLIFTNLIGAGDTTNKNCYLIHDPRPDAPDERWRFVPWDFNTSFGQGYYTQRLPAERFDLDAYRKRNAYFERVLRDPRLREPMLARYRAVMKAEWGLEELLGLLTTWSAEIARAAERDEVRWGEEFRSYWSMRKDHYGFQQEIEYIRMWLRMRWAAYSRELEPE